MDDASLRRVIEAALDALDAGRVRVAEKRGGAWHTNQWLKMAVLLSFRLYDMAVIPGGPVGPGGGAAAWFDKIASKFAGWDEPEFRRAGFRAVPNCTVRRSAYPASSTWAPTSPAELEREIATVADDLGADLDQLLSRHRQ